MIDEEGTMLGEMTGSAALELALNKGLDLIEIAPTAKPPTCKIMDYGKWKYENKKKLVAARKKQTKIVIKEIQIRPRTEDHDLNTKLTHARKFLIEGDKVKVNLRFHGREMAHQELGLVLLQRVTKILEEISIVESPPKKEGRQMFILLAPDPVKIKVYLKKVKSENKALEAEAAADMPIAPSEDKVPSEEPKEATNQEQPKEATSQEQA